MFKKVPGTMNDPWANWNKNAQQQQQQQPLNPSTPDNPMAKYDAMDKDQLLMAWDNIKKQLAEIKADEMALRKYIVARAFPEAQEGTNTQELGNGYELKAVVHYNYKLMDNAKVEEALDKITLIGNEGAFIASRIISWTPNFLLTEYRILQEQAEAGNPTSLKIKQLIDEVLIIDDAAPKLEIKEPKKKK